MHIESLELRRHLAADLAPTLVSTTLPDTVVIAAKTKPAAAVVNVTNTGDLLDKKNTANVVVSVGLVDASSNFTLLGSSNIKANKFATNKPVKATVKLAIPSGLAEGSYTLTTRIDTSAAASDEVTGNNTVSGKSVTVAVAASELFIVSGVPSFSATVEASAKGTMDIQIKNVGNTDAKAKGVIEITATDSSNNVSVIGSTNASLNIKKDATLTLKKVKITAPSSNGTYTLGVRIASTTAFGDTAFGNTANSIALTVSGSSTGTAEKPFPGSNLGNTLNFRNDTPFGIVEGGFYTDQNGLQGLWANSPGRKDTFSLSVTAEPQTSIQGTIKIAGNAIGTRTLIFGVSKAESVGSLTLKGSKTVIYFKFG